MKDAKVRGFMIGLTVAVVAWISAIPAAPGLVSTFPDAMSLLVLLVLMTIALRGYIGTSVTRRELMREAAILGTSAGTVVGVSTGIRGVVRWHLPTVAMTAVAAIGSLILVLLITSFVALIAYGIDRRGKQTGA